MAVDENRKKLLDEERRLLIEKYKEYLTNKGLTKAVIRLTQDVLIDFSLPNVLELVIP